MSCYWFRRRNSLIAQTQINPTSKRHEHEQVVIVLQYIENAHNVGMRTVLAPRTAGNFLLRIMQINLCQDMNFSFAARTVTSGHIHRFGT
jgi:hypothetical protein